jgi:20S proteasome alpha/beta subunit
MISSLPKPPRPFAPKPIPGPTPKRLPKGKPMTLVAAYRSNNGGLLLCADREENDGYAKRSVDKIYPIYLNPCTIFLAGAGPSNAIAKANEEIHNGLVEAFRDGKDVLREYKVVIQKTLEGVHSQFADILAEFPMNFLIVVVVKAANCAPILYRTDGSVMLKEDYYAAFGTGKLICDYFSDRLYEYPRLDKPNLLAVAAFIFREAHKSASGVGEDVNMIFIRPTPSLGETDSFGPDCVKEIQSGIPPLSEALWEYWKEHTKLPMWTQR